MTINILSLGGLVVGIGMMVDNSIVVIDSCFKMQDGIRTYDDAAIAGANLVNGAVIASTITTIVVFLPIALMDGMSGQLFKDVGFTDRLFADSLADFCADARSPAFCKVPACGKTNFGCPTAGLHKLERLYGALLDKALCHKLIVVAIAIVMLAGTFVMFTQIDSELMPMSDEGSISISVTTKTGLNIDETDQIMTQLEALVAEQPDVESYSMRGGGGSASITVTLKDDRSMQTDEFIALMRQETAYVENASVEVEERSSMSFGSRGVQINLSGSNLDVLEQTANEVKEVMQEFDGIDSVSTSLSDGDPRAQIVVDSVQAAAIGTTPSAVLSTVRNMISGIEADYASGRAIRNIPSRSCIRKTASMMSAIFPA